MVSASFPNRPFDLRDNVWLIGQEVGNNRSLVGFQLWIDKRSYSPTWSAGGIAHRWMKLNGGYVHEYYGNGFDFRNGSNFLLAQGEAWIPHNADGTKSLLIEAAANFDILGSTSLSVWIGLPTIPRASTARIDGPYTRDLGTGITIHTDRASGSFTHTLEYSFAGASGTIATGVGDNTVWTPPVSLSSQLPSSTSAVVTLTCHTYSGGSYVGTKTSQFTLAVPASVIPTISSLSVQDVNTNVASIVGLFVQNLSVLRATVNAAGAHGSTVQAKSYSMAGQTVASGGDIPITGSGTVALGAAATDSRSRTGSWTGNISVLSYLPPRFNTVTVQRCTAGGVVDLEAGTSLRVDLNASIQSLMNGTQRNDATIKVYTRPRGTTTWTLRNTVTSPSMTVATGFVVSGGANYPVNSAFEVQVTLADKFVTAIAQIDVATAKVFMHWSATGVGVGTYHNRGVLDVKGDMYLDGAANFEGAVNIEAAQLSLGGLLLRPSHGTTTDRNAYYGTPTTDAQRVALANQRIRWFNTTTGMWETYYAVIGTTGLTAPGVLAARGAGWYALPESEVAGLSGPTSYVGSYEVSWARGYVTPSSTLTPFGTNGITIGQDGIYECHAYLRGGPSGNAAYISLAFAGGDRVNFEKRSNPDSPNPMQGIWLHDHPAATNNYSQSHYWGKLYAGEIINSGPPYTGLDIQLGSAASTGGMVVRRIS